MRPIRKIHIGTVLLTICILVALRVSFCSSTQNDAHDGHDHGAPVAKTSGPAAPEDGAHDGHDHEHPAADKHTGGEGGKDDHKEVGGQEGHDDEDIIRLSERDRRDLGIKTEAAGPGILELDARLLGEVRINEDLRAHVVPLVSGIVTEVNKRMGDQVEKGEVLAVIASRELAELRASFLTARERRDLTRSAFEREKQLWQKKISSEQEYLDAKQVSTEAEIALLAAEQSLHALGISEEQLKQMGTLHDSSHLTRFEIRASMDGTIIAKHITKGEKVGDATDVFEIAGLGTVWVDLNVPQKDLNAVRKGQKVTISAAGAGMADITGEVAFVSPIINQETRTALARVVIPNSDGKWRPGLFVRAHLTAEQLKVATLVPNDAVQILEGEPVVFVADNGGFKSLAVSVGRSDKRHSEILSGLPSGQKVVVKGAFELKAQVVTSGLDAHAGHGH